MCVCVCVCVKIQRMYWDLYLTFSFLFFSFVVFFCSTSDVNDTSRCWNFPEIKSPWRVNSQRALHGKVNKHRSYLSSSDSETLANVCIHDITRCRGDQLPWRQVAVCPPFLFSAEFFPSSTLQLGKTETGGPTGYVTAADDCNVQSGCC